MCASAKENPVAISNVSGVIRNARKRSNRAAYGAFCVWSYFKCSGNTRWVASAFPVEVMDLFLANDSGQAARSRQDGFDVRGFEFGH